MCGYINVRVAAHVHNCGGLDRLRRDGALDGQFLAYFVSAAGVITWLFLGLYGLIAWAHGDEGYRNNYGIFSFLGGTVGGCIGLLVGM